MKTNIIPAEHIGLVSAYLSRIALLFHSEKYRWIKSPLIKKVPDWRNLKDENRSNWETDNFIEISVYPIGEWKISENERKKDSKRFADPELVEYARNIASVIAHSNVVGYNYDGPDGPFHATLDREKHYTRGFSCGRKGGDEFRQAAAWAAEYYLDNKPGIKPISLAKLIDEVKTNLALHDKGLPEYSPRFTDIFYKLEELCNVAILKALWHSKIFKESPDVWLEENVYMEFLNQKSSEHK